MFWAKNWLAIQSEEIFLFIYKYKDCYKNNETRFWDGARMAHYNMILALSSILSDIILLLEQFLY